MIQKTNFLTTSKTAQILGVSPKTVRFWAECSYLPAFKFGKQWRFDEARLLEWSQAHNNQSFGLSSISAIPPTSKLKSFEKNACK